MMFESEERQIAERIKDFIKSKNPPMAFYIMLRNGRILDIDNYRNMVSSGKINPQDAYVYIGIGGGSSKPAFYYPFLWWYKDLLSPYLLKLGLYFIKTKSPATGLRYVAFASRYNDYLSIEVTNLDTIVNNLNLRKIVFEVLGDKIISGEKELTYGVYEKIDDTFKSQIIYQLLFAGHNFREAWGIIYKYYDEDEQSLAKEVSRIAMDYDRIFHPYRVCYDMNSWKEIDCWSVKLD